MFSLDKLRVTKSMQYPGDHLAAYSIDSKVKKANERNGYLKLKIYSGIFVSDTI